MYFKLKLASVVAVTASVAVAAMIPGTRAAAQDLVPTLVTTPPTITIPAPAPAPAPEAMPAQDTDEDAAEPTPQPATLTELVDAQKQPDDMSREMKCLAGAIYFEAKGETLAGQLAVGRVIVARTKSGRFPDSYCGVVYQPSQFSFIRGHAMPTINPNSRSWREAVAIAQIANDGSWKSKSEGALFFHATSVSPHWRMTKLAQVDDHIFYR
jgi:N-acetylmuramoyl-L-alanine amidase